MTLYSAEKGVAESPVTNAIISNLTVGRLYRQHFTGNGLAIFMPCRWPGDLRLFKLLLLRCNILTLPFSFLLPEIHIVTCMCIFVLLRYIFATSAFLQALFFLPCLLARRSHSIIIFLFKNLPGRIIYLLAVTVSPALIVMQPKIINSVFLMQVFVCRVR